MIPFVKYAEISNNYCLSYFGRSNEYLVQLIQLMPFIQSKLQGLNIYLCCKDEDFHYISSYPLAIKRSELADYKPKLAYVKELTYGIIHPIIDIVNQVGLDNYIVRQSERPKISNQYVILKHSHYPTTDLNQDQLKNIERMAKIDGYELSEDINTAGWVVGVECPLLFKAAELGVKTTLVSTGVGQDLFKNMFPFCNVISI